MSLWEWLKFGIQEMLICLVSLVLSAILVILPMRIISKREIPDQKQIYTRNTKKTEVYCVVDKKENHRSIASDVMFNTYTIDVHVEGQDILKDTITVSAEEYYSINEKDSVLCIVYYTEKELVDITLAKSP